MLLETNKHQAPIMTAIIGGVQGASATPIPVKVSGATPLSTAKRVDRDTRLCSMLLCAKWETCVDLVISMMLRLAQ
jgi:hypothetical protein